MCSGVVIFMSLETLRSLLSKRAEYNTLSQICQSPRNTFLPNPPTQTVKLRHKYAHTTRHLKQGIL